MKKYLLTVMALLCGAVTIFAQTNIWTQKADFGGHGRWAAVGFSIGDKGYLGCGVSTDIFYKDFWEYDPAINVWSQKADYSGNGSYHTCGFSIGNKGYIGTGENVGGTYYKDFYEYDPVVNKWSRKADFAGGARMMATGVSIGNKGYIGAGYNSSYFKDFWEYDPSADKWTRKADFGGSPRTNPCSFSIGDKGYIGTGYYGGWTADFWEYDPATDKWTKRADFGGSTREYASGFSINNKGYIGTGYPSHLKDFWEYDPTIDKWTRKADFGGTARQEAVGFSIGNKGYIGTGLADEGNKNDFWEYTPDDNTTVIPTITSFSPTSGLISSTVTINGTNFSTNPPENIVYFGAVRAVVASATTTKLKVYVPVGTTYQPISVTVHGLTAYSTKPFVVTFEGGNDAFTQNSFAPKEDIQLGYNPDGFYVADFDGDSRTDIVTGDFNSSAISVLRNTSQSGAVSFAKKKNFAAGNGNRSCTAGDLDGDGKPDIVTTNIDANTISVLRNMSTAGNIAFASKIDFSTGDSPGYAVTGDLDGDGKPEMIITNFVSATLSVFRNTSSVGNISFETRKDFVTASGNFNCAIGDLDGDGKPDIVVGGEGPSNTFSVFRNTSTTGNISFAARLDYTTYAERKGVAIGDLDGDGKPDLAISNFNNPDHSLSVFRNTSSTGVISFAPEIEYPSGGTGSDVAIINDLNGDGKPDIILNNYWESNISVFKNIGSVGVISFALKVDYTTGSGPRWLYAADMDGDGKPDITVDNLFSETVSVWKSLLGDNGCTPPSDLNVTNITASSARLTWTLPDALTKTFEIRYRAAGDSAWLHQRKDGTQTAITLQNLTPNTTYQWQVRSNCGGEITKGANGPKFTTAGMFASSSKMSDAIIAGEFGVNISPNPVTSGVLNLQITNATANKYQLSIADMQGRILISQNLLSNGSLNKTINVATLPKGIYILKIIINKNEQHQIKFVKAN